RAGAPAARGVALRVMAALAAVLPVVAVIAPTARAQGPLNQGPGVQPLPPSPLLERYLFENPWPLVVILVLAAVAAFALLNQRGKVKHGAMVAGTLVIAAAGVWLMARAVVTTRESLRKQTYRLIDAVIRVDAARAGQILEPDAVAYFTEMPAGTPI